MEIVFEDGIPFPEKPKALSVLIEKLKGIQIGQSFLVPTRPSGKPYSSPHFTQAGHKLGMKFSIRNTDSGKRCWRVA